jgi:hypothetical protein
LAEQRASGFPAVHHSCGLRGQPCFYAFVISTMQE